MIIWIDRPFERVDSGGHAVSGPAIDQLVEAHAAIVGGARWDAKMFDAAPNLRVLARTGIGVDAVDLGEATRRGVAVTNTPDGPTVSTAEHAIALMFAVGKTLKPHQNRLLAGEGGGAALASTASEFEGLTLGLLAFGRIAKRVARIASAVGMNVIAHDPFVFETDSPVELVDFDTLLARSDVLSLHSPLAPDTVGLFNAEVFRRCKPGVIFINAARGGLVDHDALLEALDSGHVSCAGLDVTEPEPLDPAHRLLHMENVVVTPHIASSTVIGRQRMLNQAMEQAVLVLDGKPPTHLVNTDLLTPTWNDLEA